MNFLRIFLYGGMFAIVSRGYFPLLVKELNRSDIRYGEIFIGTITTGVILYGMFLIIKQIEKKIDEKENSLKD